MSLPALHLVLVLFRPAHKMQQGCDDYAYLLTIDCIERSVHVMSLKETTVTHVLCCCFKKDGTH